MGGGGGGEGVGRGAPLTYGHPSLRLECQRVHTKDLRVGYRTVRLSHISFGTKQVSVHYFMYRRHIVCTLHVSVDF